MRAEPRPPLDADFTVVSERLQRITVQIEGVGRGVGSGVIWSSRGLIVTNAHVVAAEKRIRIILAGGRPVDARLLVSDPERDLAALQIQSNGLSAAERRDSDTARVGELVVAAGTPLGLAGAVTVGILYAKPRPRAGMQAVLMADLRLAPGNSGGPLADAEGRVIGINAMVVGGLAVAVPSNAVARFIASLPGRAGTG
jgi:serine protease Do